MMNRFYVTTPIYYVNDQPHIGHAYTTILADVLARYHRLRGCPTFFLTGTDEHGQKVARAAERTGRTPQEQADSTVVRFQTLWKRLGIAYDDFLRTTETRHTRIVQAVLQDLYDRGEIYREAYDGWYCVACERFYTEKDLVGGTCPEAACGRPVERIREDNYFFRMSRYQEWLIAYIQAHPTFILPEFRRNETLGFLRKPLGDLCISRPKKRLPWGIELPFDSDFVTYVWFDALLNYVTAIGYRADDEKFCRWWPATCQLIGKDILTTHTVYWPTILKALDLPLPETVLAHGWWLVGRDKMSKTAGNVVNPMEFVDRYGADAFRYFLMAEMPLGQDASFTEEAFTRRYNTDLANDLGNMLNRVLRLVRTHAGGVIPAPGNPRPEERTLRDRTLEAVEAMWRHCTAFELDRGIARLMAALGEVNRYFERCQPWALARSGDASLGTVLYHALEAFRIIAGCLEPVMPRKMAEVRAILGEADTSLSFTRLSQWGVLKPGHPIRESSALFPRIVGGDRHGSDHKPQRNEAMEETGSAAQGSATLSYEEFAKIHLRTAKVIEASRIENADTLLRLIVDLGAERRQIVAGIAPHYRPEDVVGKTVVLVANLAPARIRGVESNGMLLAAFCGGHLRLVTVDGDVPSGAIVR